MQKASFYKGLNLNWLTAAVLAVVYFCAYQSHLSHIIFYNEEHRLFRFSSEYLSHRLHWDGLISVVTDFIVQFFYYPWLGSIIMAAMLVGISVMIRKMMEKLIGRDYLQLGVLVSLIAFLYTTTTEHPLEHLVGAFLVVAFALVICCFIRVLFKAKPRKQASVRVTILATILIAVYAISGYFYFWKKYNYNERRLLLVSHLAKQGNWDKVRHYTENFFLTGMANNMMSYYYALALYNEGCLANGIMPYAQAIGPKGLYLAWDGSREYCEYGYLLYEQLGLISIAERWEFESMVVWGETAPHLINLARYNIADNRPQVAQRFINILKQSLFYRSEASRLESCLKNGEIEGLQNPMKDIEDKPAEFMQPTELTPNLEYLLGKAPKNKMAYEYLMCSFILENRLDDFAKWYPRAKDFYEEIPQTFTEALNYHSQNENNEGKEAQNE